MSEKKVFRVRMGATEFPIASTESEEYVRSLATQIDARLQKIAHAGKGCSQLEAAILCALDLLDEQVRRVDFIKGLQAQILSQAEQIADLKATLEQFQAPQYQNDAQDGEQLCLLAED